MYRSAFCGTNPNQDEENFYDLKPNPSLLTKQVRDLMRSERAASFSDVTLISLEGTKIPAIRALLAIRSSYFDKLFTCEFAEKNSSTVNVSLPTVLLRRVLDFMYTDDCPMVREICFPSQPTDTVKCDSVLKIIQLAFAADYAGVEKLLQLCKEALVCVIEESKHPLCIALEELSQTNALWGVDIVEAALLKLARRPHLVLLKGCDECNTHYGVRDLSGERVEKLLKTSASGKIVVGSKWDKYRQAVFLQVLIVWGTVGKILLPNWSECQMQDGYVFIDVDNVHWDPDLFPVAKRLTRHFDLTCFSPTVLSEVVEKSGLFSDRDITVAYRQLALTYEREEKRPRWF